MVFYITKYALSGGIIALETSELLRYSTNDGRLFCTGRDGNTAGFAPGEWYTEKGMAIQDAEMRRQKKIASLRKQLAKLEQMSFQPEDLH